jgi:hypothetical protein
VTNKGELGNLTVTDESDNIIFEKNYSGQEAITDSIVYIISDTVSVGQNVLLNFTATEPKNDIFTVDLFVIEIVAWTLPIVEALDITSNYISTTLDNTMMFDLTDEGVIMEGGDFNDGELAFFWDNTYGYCILSPNAYFIAIYYSYFGITYTTDNKQETKIQKYSSSWQDLTSETIDELNITSEWAQVGGIGVQELEVGDIIVFETADGRKGALLVKINAKIDMSMTVDLKYQVQSGVY